jgi:hypothetical protein
MNMRPRTLFTLVLIAGFGLHAPRALAQSAPPPPLNLPQLMARFSTVKAANAHFTERKYLHMLKSPLDDSGVLIYVAPDKLQKNTMQPELERLAIHGDTLTIEREGKTQTFSLAQYPQVGGFIEGIRATLAGDLATLQRIYDTHLGGGIDAWQLALQPRDPTMQKTVQSIYISGSDVHIKRIETVEHDGDRTEMTIVEDHP